MKTVSRWLRALGAQRRRGVTLALFAASAGMSLALLGPLFSAGESATALACGLGNTPTMLANKAPALLYPVTTNVPADQPIGIFALDYVSGQPIAFSEDLSRVVGAPPPSTFQWRWDFGDGSAPSSDENPTHTFAAAGAYNVHAQIYDTTSSSWTDLDSAAIHVIAAAVANPPVAHITASANATAINGSVTFDASGSHSSDGSPVKYLWNFNDGQTATTAKVTHTFAIPGQGFVALIVTDGRGARSVATTNILIASGALSASVTTATPGTAVNFDATQSGASAFPSYSWDFGDGTPAQTTEAATVSHTFTRAGAYTVVATGSDPSGARETFYASVTVIAPTARAARTNILPLLGAIVLILLLGVGGFYLLQAQRRRNALIKRRVAAMELARARQVGGKRDRQPTRPAHPGSRRAGAPDQPLGAPRRPPGAPPDPRRAGQSRPAPSERTPRRDERDDTW